LLPSPSENKPGNAPYGLNVGYAPTLTPVVAEENPELPAQILSLHQETEFLHVPMKRHLGG